LALSTISGCFRFMLPENHILGLSGFKCL